MTPLLGMTAIVMSTSIGGFSLNTKRSVVGRYGDRIGSGHPAGPLLLKGLLGGTQNSSNHSSLQPGSLCECYSEGILILSNGLLLGRTIVFVFLGFTLFNRNSSIIITDGSAFPLLLK